MRILTLLFVAALFFVACEAPVTENAEEQATVSSTNPISLYSMTLFEMPDGITEDSLLTILNLTNQAIDRLGYTENGYELMQATVNRDSTDFNYMIRGSWTDQSTYDKIHAEEAYKKAGGPSELWDTVMANSQYYRMEVVK